MKKTFDDDYYVGLDIGTDSIGWAVTDKKYNILKFNQKAMWGIRLFDGAETAETRRMHRAERRRNDRKKWRINLLQELFAEAIHEVDDKFFLRLKESKYWAEDKIESGHQPNTLFNDTEYDDRNYHKKYESIYHLRKALIEGDEEALKDPRLVYLACHHIIKNRGHFLYSGELNSVLNNIQGELNELNQIIEDQFGIRFQCNDISEFETVIKDNKSTISFKKKKFKELFVNPNDDKEVKKKQQQFAELLAGSKKSVCDILDIKDSESDKKIDFSSGDFDENKAEYEELCGEKFYILEKFKKIYDWGVLQQILKGNIYISYAKVETYEKHKKDLNLLKNFIRDNLPKEYNKMFRSINEPDNYCAYIGTTMKNGKKYSVKQCSYEAFLKKLKKTVESVKMEDEDKNKILSEIEAKTFLPKQITKDNGVIPYQVHKNELEVILDNAKKYHSFLNISDEYGTVADKIISILKFKIPYYVGPLNTANRAEDTRRGFSWAERKTQDKIRPWNFKEVIDEEKSAQNFILRMTNKCTYLPWADVLPKDSIKYQTYMVLNELNNLKINDSKLSVEAKQDVFENLFKKKKKVSNRSIIDFLKQNKYIEPDGEYKISGIDGAFKSSMSSYYLLSDVFKDNGKVDETVMEKIIFFATIFGDEKEMFVSQVKKLYGNLIDENELKKLKGLNFNGWGNFSKEFLVDITDVDMETGEMHTDECECILRALYNHQENLMQLLSNEHKFAENIERLNREKTETSDERIKYSDVEELYASPAVKRAVWQTMLILKEIRKITGKNPKKIFVEMARGNEKEKNRTESRQKQLQRIYDNIGKDIKEWEAEDVLKSLDSKSDEDLRRNKLYLWYTQLGKCMYSGETILLEDLLYNNDKYDIDHIYPQSKIDDDSIQNNKVLVRKEYNSSKGNNYPLPSEWRKKQYEFWNMLKRNHLITDEKYKRLIRNYDLTESELTTFAARQLVETRQSTKIVGQLIERYFGNCVVYVKAGNVSNFRQGVDDTIYGYKNKSIEEKTEIKEYILNRQKENEFIKCRSVNDFHHAKDAYLNIVVGNVYDTKYTSDPMNYIKKKIETQEFNSHSIRAIYKFKVERNGNVAWIPSGKEKEGTMATVKKYMRKNNILFTRYAIEKKHGQNGGLYDQNIVKAAPGLRPIKGSDERLCKTERYGGYKTVTPAYFMLIKYKDKKGRVVKRIETLPLYMKSDFEKNAQYRQAVLEKFAEKNDLKEPELLIAKIKFNALLSINGFKVHLTGNNENQLLFKNANQLVLKEENIKYIKRLENFKKRYDENKESRITAFDEITKEDNLALYGIFENKLKNTVYKEKLEAQIKTLGEAKGKFIEINIEEQSILLLEILNLFRCIPNGADLSLLGKGKGVGVKITISKNLNPKDNIYLCSQSVTGLFEGKAINISKL